MARRPSIEDRLEHLAAVRQDPGAEGTLAQLTEALGDPSNVVVGRAARVVGELGFSELAETMAEAFARFYADGDPTKAVERDKGCLAKAGLAAALAEMDDSGFVPGVVELFRRGARWRQMEASWGESIDTAIELRAACAIGLANSTPPDAALELARLLADEATPVRLAAAQGLGAIGRTEGEAVLRFKALLGDDDPEVVTECCTALLRLEPRRSLIFVDEEMLGSGQGRVDAARRAAAVLALGESRLEEAVELLEREWRRGGDREVRRAILLALVASRRKPALDLLFALVAGEEALAAHEAVAALGVLRHDSQMQRRTAEAVESSPHREALKRRMAREFA